MVKVAIEKPRISTSLRRRTLAGIDTAIRLTNSQKAEFIVHPATGGTSSGQKRAMESLRLCSRRKMDFLLFFTTSISLCYIVNTLHYGTLLQEIVLLSFGAFHF